MQTDKPQLRDEYKKRINRVIDYIEDNLTEKHTLASLSKIANFSEFHFHRIFKAFVGESLNQFIRRVKLERIAQSLLQFPNKPITDICYDYGFSSPAVMTRAFTDYFGMPPNEWRQQEKNNDSKISKLNSKNSKAFEDDSPYFCDVSVQQLSIYLWSLDMEKNGIKMDVEVKELPETTVAYVRHIGPYAGDEQLFGRLFGKLMQWAAPRGLIKYPETQCLSVYHDNPDITDEDKLRVSCCITVPEGTAVDGEIGKMVMPGGKYAMGKVEILPEHYGEVWNMLYGSWLPESGYAPDDRPCFELYHNDPKEHPQGKHIVSICAAVKPL